MTWPETFERAAAHFSALATRPGWWQYAQQRVAELEKDELWTGLRDAVRERVRVSGYRPPRSELGEWWEIRPAPLPVVRRRW